MFYGKQANIIALIPARGGSVGIRHKNVVKLANRPLIHYTIKASLDSDLVKRTIVSTDDKVIAKIAADNGAEVPFIRPVELAKNSTPMIDVLKHALTWLEKNDGYLPEAIVLLQPTSPLRNAIHIDDAIKKFIKLKADSIVSVCQARYSPYWMKTIIRGMVKPFIKEGELYVRRQDLPKVYELNGAIYITRPGIVLKKNCILGPKTYPYLMESRDSVDIDTYEDFMIAKAFLESSKKSKNKS